jgi:hypothetical protein
MKYMALYRASVPAEQMMANGTPEQAQEGMQAWMAWAQRVGTGLADMGAPLGKEAFVPAGTAPAGDGHVTGYSIIEADSQDAALSLFDGHPHLMSPGASIEVLELLPVPGM